VNKGTKGFISGAGSPYLAKSEDCRWKN